MACAFRPLAREDLSEAARIYNHYVAHSTSTFHTVPRTEARWRRCSWRREPFAAYALTEEGKLIGYCALVHTAAGGLTPSRRSFPVPDSGDLGKGYGQAMLTSWKGRLSAGGLCP